MISFDTHSASNLPPLAILKKFILTFVRFGKSCLFSCILLQICYNFVKIFSLRNVGHWTFSIGKKCKTETFDLSVLRWMIFLPYYNYRREISRVFLYSTALLVKYPHCPNQCFELLFFAHFEIWKINCPLGA